MDLELRGSARTARRIVFYGLAASGVVALIGYWLPAHAAGHLELHSNYADGGMTPPLLLAVVTAVTVWASRKRFGAGMISAAVSGVVASIALVRTAFAHPLSPVHSIYGEYVHLGGLVAMFGFAMLLFIMEPALYDAERKRQTPPEVTLPRAQVVK
jgi:hypothetical protein